MLLKLRQKRRNLLGRQPAERSSKSSEEDDDTGLIFPQFLECCHLLGHGVGQFSISYLHRIHLQLRNYTVLDNSESLWIRVIVKFSFNHKILTIKVRSSQIYFSYFRLCNISPRPTSSHWLIDHIYIVLVHEICRDCTKHKRAAFIVVFLHCSFKILEFWFYFQRLRLIGWKVYKNTIQVLMYIDFRFYYDFTQRRSS